MADEVIQEFLVESYESLEEVERDLVELEEQSSAELISRIFRNIHTIKGTCGFLGYGRLEGVAHAGENLLSKLREGELVPTEPITSALLATVDAIRTMLELIEQTEADGDEPYEGLRQTLHVLAAGAPEEAAPPAPAIRVEGRAPMLSAPPPRSTEPADVAPEAAPEPTPAPAVEVLTRSRDGAEAEGEHRTTVADTSIRVHVELLDTLMNLVGELVLVRNQILQHQEALEDSGVSAAAQRLNLVTSELQEGVMRTRMQPIGQVWSKFPRIVRDLAHQLGKECRLEMEGKETELDKTILEAIKDPLTHLVRNSVDHGIESAEAREARGKNPEGTLTLRAYHEGGQVNIEISDDGSGVNLERVAQKALEHGLVKREQLERMTEKSLLHLIFLPGFSTAKEVTNVSGRGVGMDVVKTNIERIGGTIDVTSSAEGTTFKIKIPLTLAIVPALLVGSGGDRYAIPQVNLVELVRLEEEQEAKIERIHGAPVYRLRGKLLPLVFLHEQLGVERQQSEESGIHIAVLQAGDELFGLVVEDIRDTEEIVVKPLSRHLKELGAFSGATIMGDGRVALILDAPGIAAKAGLASKDRDAALALEEENEDASALDQTLLLFEVAEDRVVGVQLANVQRLEEFDATRVERAGSAEVVQYRDRIMPLMHLGKVLFGQPPPAYVRQDGQPATLQVIVCQREGQTAGLVVDRLIDIVEARVDLAPEGRRHGVLGSAVVQGRVVEMVDVAAVLGEALPTLGARG